MVNEVKTFIKTIPSESGPDAKNTAIILEKLGIAAGRTSVTPQGAGSEIHMSVVPEVNRKAFEASLAALMALSPAVRSKIVELLNS